MNQTDSAGAQNKNTHAVYLIGNGRSVKIGHAADPQKRMADLATASDAPLSLEWWWTMPRAEAVRFEAQMHEHLSMHRVHREWFAISPRAALLIGCALRKGDSITANKILICEWTISEADEEIEDNRLALLKHPSAARRRELAADTEAIKELRDQTADELEWWWCELDPEDEGLE